MHHYFEALTNTSGESLIGYFARVIDPDTQATVTLASDESGTPIATVSGVANMAKTDDYGNIDFYVAPGIYHLDIYATDSTTFRFRVPNVGMQSVQGEQGPQGDKGDPGPAGNVADTLATLKASAIANGTMIYDEATFTWTAGDYSALEDDVNYVASNDVAITSGAWVRQSAAKVRVQQAGNGAVIRDAQAKLRESVSVLDFGAVGDGVTDDSAAFQAALDTGKAVFAPKGSYMISSPITTTASGQRIYGESCHSTYLVTPSSSTNDIVRIANSHCEVDHLHFRPGSTGNKCIRVYAALASIHHSRFLSASNNQGIAIWLDDVDPVTSDVVAGAYIHSIDNNYFGASGFAFQYGIYCHSVNNGQQANCISKNQFWCDAPIYVTYGGGNVYRDNLFQSSTGTSGTPAGVALDFQTSVVGEIISGNYFERYANAVNTTRSTNDLCVFEAFGNEYEYITDPVNASFGTTHYIIDNRNAKTREYLGWTNDFSEVNKQKFSGPNGILWATVDGPSAAFSPRLLGFNHHQTLSFTANGQTGTPVGSYCEITGSGAGRTGCFLANGIIDGQHLYLRGFTWSVEILNNPSGAQNIVFAGDAASATFGQTAGQVIMMHLIWDAAYGSSGMWFEVSRCVR